MPYYCTVPRCTSMAGKAKNVSFHQFPRDEELAKLWNDILKRGKPYTKYSKVCSLHFRPEDYTITSVGKNKGQWRTLRKDAIPSQNLPLESPPGGPQQRRRSSGAWVPSSLPPNTVDPQIQQQMAQAIYIQTMLAMQAATNGSHQVPIADAEPPTQNASADAADHRQNIDRHPDQSVQKDNIQEIQNSNHSVQVHHQYKKTSYKCEECSKCFKDPDVFVLHKRTHTAKNLDIHENLPATMKAHEKENFNTNSDFSSQETLRANPILANLLKSGISPRIPEMSNSNIDSNNVLSIENQIMTALAANMETYIRNLSTMLSNQANDADAPDSRIEHNTDQLSPNSEQDVNYEDDRNSDPSPLQDDYNTVDDDDDFAEDLQFSMNKTQNSVGDDFNVIDSQNSLQGLRDYQSSRDLTQSSVDGYSEKNCFGKSQNLLEDDNCLQEHQNIEESQGSEDCDEPICDNQDLNESKDSNNLVIEENV